jgi:uncharacterized protein YcbX
MMLNSGSNLHLAGLYIHPIKSCASIAVTRARVMPEGLEHDRRWMLVDSDGRMVSQRDLPAMVLLRPRIDVDAIVVSSGDRPELRLPFVYDDGARVAIEIWKHRGPAVLHEAGSRWFTAALGHPLRLVCLPPSIARPVDPAYADPGDRVSFADGFPYLVANAASLADLNARSNYYVDARRFRPNLVIAGAAPWAEDNWQVVRVGGLRFRLVKPCARCTIPAVDPDTGATSKEPLRTLASFRRRDHEVYFGINAIADEHGELSVGDIVTVEAPPPI